jgi:hypothetical protein
MVSRPDFLDDQVSLDDGGQAQPQQVLPPGFDGLQYIASYGDLIPAFGANEAAGEQHYLAFGEAEGREIDTFNEVGYLERYPDLQAAFGSDVDAATRHYIEFGFGEGRTYPPLGLPEGFDGLQYIASHDDLIPAFGANETAGEQHYLNFGEAEGREIATFDEQQYLANYEDLRAAFGDDADAATAHYIRFGFGEGRSDSQPPVFDVEDEYEVEENTTDPVVTLAATDPDGGEDAEVTFERTGGEDAELFDVNEEDELVFVNIPDFEDASADGDDIYEVEVAATDAEGVTATQAIAVTVTDVGPTAAADAADATIDGQAVPIDVLGNDGPDGAELTVADVGDLEATQGTVALGDGGANVIYTPPAGGDPQVVTFDYTVEDEAGEQDTATVTVTLTAGGEMTPTVEAAAVDFLF